MASMLSTVCAMCIRQQMLCIFWVVGLGVSGVAVGNVVDLLHAGALKPRTPAIFVPLLCCGHMHWLSERFTSTRCASGFYRLWVGICWGASL